MARGRKRTENSDGDQPQDTRSDNASHVKKVIAEVAGIIIQLKGEKSAIQEQITEARGRIKSLGIKAAEFNVALRYYELQAEDRNTGLDNLRLCFEGLGMGAQLDWITASEPKNDNGDVRPPFLRDRTAESETAEVA